MTASERYFNEVTALIPRLRDSQRDAIEAAVQIVARRLAAGGIIHLFGTGHSHMLAEEVFYRAGGLIPVQAMLDPTVLLSGGARRSTVTERTTGAAAEIAGRYDLRVGDVGIVISNSGRNPAPVEMAELMKGRGLAVIAVTSIEHSRALPPFSPGSRRLFEVADIVLDNCGAYGDARMQLNGVPHPVGPTSTIAGVALLQAVVIGAMEQLVTAGHAVVNLPSANVEGHDLTAIAKEIERYRDRIRHW